jgi:hypothetical protein
MGPAPLCILLVQVHRKEIQPPRPAARRCNRLPPRLRSLKACPVDVPQTYGDGDAYRMQTRRNCAKLSHTRAQCQSVSTKAAPIQAEPSVVGSRRLKTSVDCQHFDIEFDQLTVFFGMCTHTSLTAMITAISAVHSLEGRACAFNSFESVAAPVGMHCLP